MKTIITTIFLALICLTTSAQTSLHGLLTRTVPADYVSRFSLEVVPGSNAGEDFFELSTVKGKTIVKGNNPVSVAFGLNWYLKYYCNVSDSWCGSQRTMPSKLPALKEPFKMATPLQTGFYLNYCTFSYSMPYWDWADWEREIDRMAFNGITTPMAMIGVENVWMATLREFGYSDDEILKFIPGAGYMGWFLMGNLEGMGGPLSKEWLERQDKLQKQILERMRELGMEPVFQAFFGMVPTTFAETHFEADIVGQGKWMTYDRPSILNPSDPLFARMAEVWYANYKKLYGDTKYWAGDLFHEGGKTGNMDVAQAAAGVQNELQKASPGAVWVIQSWGGNPKKELLKGLNRDNILIVDLCAEYWDRWSERGAFEESPWIWGNITNWGGNVGLHGRLDAVATEPVRAQNDPIAGKWLRGTANVPEGIGTNPVVFDLACEMRWRSQSPKLPDWLHSYAAYRYGAADAKTDAAWDIFYKTAYGTYKGHRRPSESYLCARPSLDVKTVSAWGSAAIYYDEQEFLSGVRLFAQAYEKFKNCDAYIYDLVDFTRQVVANRGRTIYHKMIAAYKAKDKESLKVCISEFQNILRLQDELLSTRSEFCLSSWIDKARAAADDPAQKNLLEYNARALITTWTAQQSSLVDYAHREWSGLIRDYYAPRWQLFFDWMVQTVDGTDIPKPDFAVFEQKFANSTVLSPSPKVSLIETICKVLE